MSIWHELPNLKPCPFCGGEVSIGLKAYAKEGCFFITRGNSKIKNNCTCRVFMESEPYYKCYGSEDAERVKNNLVEAWNRRANDEAHNH